MPLRRNDSGSWEAFYVGGLGPNRAKSGGGQKYKEPLLPRLRGDEDADDLAKYFAGYAEWVEEKWASAKIGNSHGEIQESVDWMNLAARCLNIRTRFYVAKPKEVRPVLTGQEDVDEFVSQTEKVCNRLDIWYQNDHGTPLQHQWWVNMLNLALHLVFAR